MGQHDRRLLRVQYLRDVGANVLANVAAAPLIYLLGAAAGLFPKSREAIFTSLIILGTAGLYLLTIAEYIARDRHRRELYAASSLFGLSVVAVGLIVVLHDTFIFWLFLTLGLVSFWTASWGIYRAFQRKRAADAQGRRIRGLHWFEGRP